MVIDPGDAIETYRETGNTQMTRLRFISAAAIVALTSGFALAQTPAAPTTPAKPAMPAVTTMPAVTAPAAAPAVKAAPVAQTAPAVTAPAAKPAPVAAAKKIDLNTATADELDKLPQIGPARSKLIVEARAKTKFKDWADFDKRDVIPQNAEAAIKDLVVIH